MQRQGNSNCTLRCRKPGKGFVNQAYNVDKQSSGWCNDSVNNDEASSNSGWPQNKDSSDSSVREEGNLRETFKVGKIPGTAVRVKNVFNFKSKQGYKRLDDNQCKDKDV